MPTLSGSSPVFVLQHLRLKRSSLLNVYLNCKFESSLLSSHLFFSLINLVFRYFKNMNLHFSLLFASGNGTSPQSWISAETQGSRPNFKCVRRHLEEILRTSRITAIFKIWNETNQYFVFQFEDYALFL